MPILRCGPKKKGYKFGKKGKCYTGKNARKKAVKQGRAIKASQIRAIEFNKKYWGEPRWE